MSTRCADPASLPALFAGMTAAASASTARPERASVDISRWVHPAPRASSCLPHRLTVARAHCRRLPRLFNHRAEGAGEAGFVAEKLSLVRWHSRSSLRTCSSAWRPRAAAAGPARAAVAARKPPARPQGPRGPAGSVYVAFVGYVDSPWSVAAFGLSGACRAEMAMSVSLRMECVVDLYT